jgi:DNA-binding transcriptional regulator YdaS (Cro superfamily)
VQSEEVVSENIPEISSIESRVRYLSQFVGGLNALAERIGISPRQLGNYLRGKAPWPSRRITAIAAVTGVSPAWITDGIGEIPRPEAVVRSKRKASAVSAADDASGAPALSQQNRAADFAAQLRAYAGRISTLLLAQADYQALRKRSQNRSWRPTKLENQLPARLTST